MTAAFMGPQPQTFTLTGPSGAQPNDGTAMDFGVDVAPSLDGHSYRLHLHSPGDNHFTDIAVASSSGLHLSFHFAPPAGIEVGTWIAHLYVDGADIGTSTTFTIGT